MDDFLYILLAIGWVVFGIYKNYQKQAKKSQTVTKKAPLPKKREIKDIFEDFFPVEEIKRVEQKEETKEVVNKQSEIYTAENKSLETIPGNDYFSYEKESSEKGIKNKDLKINEKSKLEEVVDNIEKFDFDLRKAVIYKAILERPY